jgi:flavin-dependent dehydrogenase
MALGRADIDVWLFERGQPGKDKACGDALLPAALELLQHCDIAAEDLATIGGVPFERLDLWTRDVRFWNLHTGARCGYILPRAALDQLLRDQAARSASIRYGAAVTDLICERDGTWSVHYRQINEVKIFSCDAVIIATGAHNQLAKQFGIAGEPIEAASITTYASDMQLEAPIFQFTGACQPGYGWMFPIEARKVNLGVCALLPDRLRVLRKIAEGYLGEHSLAQLGSWRGGGQPLWSGRGWVWHHRAGVVSCGDAAGVVDPLSGEGITAALASGKQAGQALVDYLWHGTMTMHLETYSAWVREHFQHAYQPSNVRRIWSSLCGM